MQLVRMPTKHARVKGTNHICRSPTCCSNQALSPFQSGAERPGISRAQQRIYLVQRDKYCAPEARDRRDWREKPRSSTRGRPCDAPA